MASRARSAQTSSSGSRSNPNWNAKFCTYCKRCNHDFDSCWTKETNESRFSSLSSQRGEKSSSNTSRSVSKAAKASVVTLEFTDDKDSSQDDVVAKAKSAKVFLASSIPSRDWNIDSGYSLSMTPFASSLSNLHPSKDSSNWLTPHSSVQLTQVPCLSR